MIVGIDLGTTNSLVAQWSADGAHLVPNVHRTMLTPSAVGVDDEGRIIIGESARFAVSAAARYGGDGV